MDPTLSSFSRRLVITSLIFCATTFLMTGAWMIGPFSESGSLQLIAADLAASPATIFQFCAFIATYVGLHILLAMIWAWVWLPIGKKLHKTARDDLALATLSFLLVLTWLLLANARLFPHSLFVAEFDSNWIEQAMDFLWAAISLALAMVLAVSLGSRVWRLWRLRPDNHWHSAGLASLFLALILLVAGSNRGWSDLDRDREQPDVILLGIDSLRLDHISSLDPKSPVQTPALDELLAKAGLVEEAWTPLARTFPSWVSILTGRYPSAHGAYFNLMRRSRVDDADSLAHWLGTRGYERVYAIDETRFSNIDQSYGFDTLVAPGIGAFDFVAGAIGDLPLANLISYSAVGEWLFPFVHMNRGVSRTYHPEIFERRIDQAISEVDPARPLFLALHLELAHWPYSWADKSPDLHLDSEEAQRSPLLYQRAVARVDQQLGAVVGTLARHGRLKNAIVVMLTDHGEAFGPSEPDWIANGTPPRQVMSYLGHGTSVFGASQYRVLMAFRGYGPQAAIARGVRTTASLVDIRPTLEDWLGSPSLAEVDGISLLPLLQNPSSVAVPRAVTLETGFSLRSIKEGNPDTAELLKEGAQYYEVDQSGRLSIREEWVDFLRAQKQRAAVSGDWLLVAYPPLQDEASPPLVLGNLRTLEYWDARDAMGRRTGAPIQVLLDALCHGFSRHPEFRLPECAH